jgi:excisionase family DNA binding protein
MATVGISEAARLVGVSRQHIYKMVEKGEISVVKELKPGKSGDDPTDYRQLVDVSELQRVFGNLSTVDSSVDSRNRQPITPFDSPVDSEFVRMEADLLSGKQLLREREEQLRKAEEREAWLKKQVDETQNIVKLLGHSKPADTESTVPAAKHDQVVKNGRRQITELQSELEKLKSRGFFARLFNK